MSCGQRSLQHAQPSRPTSSRRLELPPGHIADCEWSVCCAEVWNEEIGTVVDAEWELSAVPRRTLCHLDKDRRINKFVVDQGG